MPKRPIKADDLLQLVLVGDPQISPDGCRVLFSRKHINEKNKYITNLWIADGKEVIQWTQGENGDGQGRWSPDGSQIAFVSGRDKPGGQIFLISCGGGEARKLSELPEGSIGEMKWSPDGKYIAFTFREQHPGWTEKAKKEREEKGLSTPARELDDLWYRLDGDGYFLMQRYAIYLIEAATGESKMLYNGGTFDQYTFDWSPDSKEIAVAHSIAKRPMAEPSNVQVFRVNLEGQAWQLEGLPPGSKEALCWSPDGNFIAFAGYKDPADEWGVRNTQVFVVPAGGGSYKCLTDEQDYCAAVGTLSDTKEAGFSAVLDWTPDSKALYVQIGWHGSVQLGRIDISKGGIELLTDEKMHVGIGNVAKGGRIACTFGSAILLPEVGWIDVKGKKAQIVPLTHFNEAWHKSVKLSEPEELWLDTPDKTKLHGWVMKPIGYIAPKRYPAVLQIHGGPHGQYGWAFFHEMQLLAAHGYVVVYTNPRGSKGYGEAHTAAIRGDWGNKDWIDIQTITHWMQHQPYIHPGQMAVMGGSYGGYMTNWVIGHCQDFKTAITDRCVSNLVSMAGSSDFPIQPDTYWKGTPWSSLKNIETLWKQSPIAYFDQVQTPTLIIHSEGDLRCNVEQSEQVFTALQQRGIESRFVRYPQSTFHGLSRSGPPDLRLHRLNEIVTWLDAHLK